MNHLAICVMVRGERTGFVISGPSFTKLERVADKLKGRIGYVGDLDYATAERRAGMMERDEPGAWGPLEPSEVSQ